MSLFKELREQDKVQKVFSEEAREAAAAARREQGWKKKWESHRPDLGMHLTHYAHEDGRGLTVAEYGDGNHEVTEEAKDGGEKLVAHSGKMNEKTGYSQAHMDAMDRKAGGKEKTNGFLRQKYGIEHGWQGSTR